MDTVSNVARIYERVKFRNTGQARLILPKKNPRTGVNYEYLEKFCKLSYLNNVIPNFYFQAMYDQGEKIIPTKPECRLLNDKKNLHYYIQWVKKNCADLKDIVESINRTEQNILLFMEDNKIEETITNKNFFSIYSFNRIYPDWIIMLKIGLISPIFLWTNDALKFYVNLIPKNDGQQFYENIYSKYNKNGRFKNILNVKFNKYIPESVADYIKAFENRRVQMMIQES